MSYKFKATENFAKGLQRIAASQAEVAGSCLDAGQDVRTGVHEVRKSIKRLRALLSLYRGAISRSELRRIDHQLRDMGRSLSALREWQGKLDAIASLEERFGAAALEGPLANLKAQIKEQQRAASSKDNVQGHVSDLEHGLARATAAIGDLDPSETGFDAIREGLAHTYRQARRWHERAYADHDDAASADEIFYEWRKHVQRHWRHMQLLSPAWPRELKARAELCHAIGETIGRDHDLAVLDARLQQGGRSLGPLAQVRTARRMCRERQLELREIVRVDGARLFLEGARAFTGRIGDYWHAAQREKAMAKKVDRKSESRPVPASA